LLALVLFPALALLAIGMAEAAPSLQPPAPSPSSPEREPSPAEPDDPPPPGTPPEEPGDDDYGTDPVALPDTRAGKELGWVLDVINGRTALGDPAAKFTKPFLEAYPPDEIRTVLTTMKADAFQGAPVVLVSLDEFVNVDSLSGIIRGEGVRRALSVFISVDETSGLIAGLLFNRAGYSGGGGGGDDGWESIAGDLGKLRGAVGFAAFELVPAKASPDAPNTPITPNTPNTRNAATATPRLDMVPVHEFGWDKRLNVAGASRVVLALGVARQIAEGKHGWDDPITVQESLKSAPGSDTFAMEAGTTLTLDEALYRTMTALDASAWDHVVATVGREPLDAAFASVVVDTRRTLPTLSTREFFALKLAADDATHTRYTEADAAGRLSMLATQPEPGAIAKEAATLNWDLLGEWQTPTRVETVGVFMTADELCKAMRSLRELEMLPGARGEDGEQLPRPMVPLGEALRDNGSGLDLDPDVWKSAAWTSGFEPGAGAHAWLLERADGRWFTLAIVWNAPDRDIDETQLLELGRRGINIVTTFGTEPTARPDAASGKELGGGAHDDAPAAGPDAPDSPSSP
jgi:hypothetical protein